MELHSHSSTSRGPLIKSPRGTQASGLSACPPHSSLRREALNFSPLADKAQHSMVPLPTSQPPSGSPPPSPTQCSSASLSLHAAQRGRQADKQTDKQSGRQVGRQTDRQADLPAANRSLEFSVCLSSITFIILADSHCAVSPVTMLINTLSL